MTIDWQAVAVHEAGHAVVAKHFDFDLLALFIRGDRAKKGGLWCDPPKPREYTTRTDSDQFTGDDKHAMFIDVCHLLAGQLAESLAGLHPNPQWSEEDNAEIKRIADWHFPDDPQGKETFLAGAKKETERVLRTKWDSVTAIASFLVRSEPRMWGREVEAMIK